MREKRLFHVIGFATTTQAMAWEAYCKEENIPGRIIPLPEQLSAGCGLAWRMTIEDWNNHSHMLNENSLKYENDKDIVMYG